MLLNAYCSRSGLYPEDVRFTFEGDTLPLTATPAKYDLDDEDIIDASIKIDTALGQPRRREVQLAAPESTPANTSAGSGKRIVINVQLCGGQRKSMQAGSAEPFAVLVDELARKLGVTGDKIVLHLEGDPLPLDRSPGDLNFEGGETIEAVIDGPINSCSDDEGTNAFFGESSFEETDVSAPSSAASEGELAEQEDKVTLFLQTKEDKQSFRMGKSKTFGDLLKAFRVRNPSVPVSAKVSLFLDGEKLSMSDTPEDMDLEDEDVIDVRIA